MAESGPRNPTASASIVTGWTDIANVYGSDNARAYASALTAIMAATGFGFSIPTGATITGILIELEGFGDSPVARRRGIVVGPSKNGTSLAGDNGSQINMNNGSANEAYYTWGGDGRFVSLPERKAEAQAAVNLVARELGRE